MRTYEPGTKWNYQSFRGGHELTEELVLYWEANGDPISDDFTPDDIEAPALFAEWRRWLKLRDGWSKAMGEPWVDIIWFVTTTEHAGTFEGAPFQVLEWLRDDDDFLTFFTWPVDASSREPLNWLRLPVDDKLWREARGDKGGFIQEATGWKPSPLQSYVNVDVLVKASRA